MFLGKSWESRGRTVTRLHGSLPVILATAGSRVGIRVGDSHRPTNDPMTLLTGPNTATLTLDGLIN